MRRGIPTVRARTLQDAFRVQGYLQARERLFQMELGRRVAGGELAELVGAAALPLDRKQRVYGFAQVAEEAMRTAPDDQRADAQALADGVNAFIASHRGRWGVEFQMLGLEPRPWTPADSIRLLLLFHQQLSESWQNDLLNEALDKLPPARRDFLTPEVSTEDVLVVPDAAPPPPPSTAASSPAAPRLPPRSSRRSGPAPRGARRPARAVERRGRSGGRQQRLGPRRRAHRPRKAHPRQRSAPRLRHARDLVPAPHRAGRRRRNGAAVDPGRRSRRPPGLVIFQNDRLAIGYTNIGTDVQDLYREPEVGQRVETIAVKGAPSETLTVSLGRHGPMVAPRALPWPGQRSIRPRSALRRPLHARHRLGEPERRGRWLPRSGPEPHVRRRGGPRRMASDRCPSARARGRRPVPLDGTTSAHDWSGYLPQDRMPRLLDPPSGRVVTANQRAIGTRSASAGRPAGPPHPCTSHRRADREGRQIDARQVRTMQLDTVAIVHREVVQRLAPLLRPKSRARSRAGTDGRTRTRRCSSRRRRSAAAPTRRCVAAALQGSAIGPVELHWYDNDPTLLAAVRASPEAWRKAGLGERDAVLGAAVREVALDSPGDGGTVSR